MKNAETLQTEQDRLTQRLLAIPGITLPVSFDPAILLPPADPPKKAEEKFPPRRWLFEKTWLGFSLHHDQEVARRRFVQQFGHPPIYLYQDFTSRILWVGPV